jgi:squalene-associated FAD-dependent desaturase
VTAPQSVTVVGGGLAGLSAACALADSGYHVRLLERRPYVGGRASSYEHPGTGEVIDNCQHVLIGRCTNLIDLYRRLGSLDAIRWYDHFTFIEPGGRRTLLQPSSLPAPLHTSLAFLRAPAFSLADKLAIARGMSAFLTRIPEDTEENFAHWLQRHGQTQRAIDRFWRPVLVSALNEDLDRISIKYAGKVFRESFLLSPEAGRMGIPSIPLSSLYGRAIDYLQARGGEVHLRTSVDAIEPVDSSEPEMGWIICSSGRALNSGRASNIDRAFTSDAVVLALSFEALAALLPALPRNAQSENLAADLAQFEHSPITGIHLWFDREITDLEHAVLLDSTIQWLFNKSKLQPAHRAQQGSYIELVVSSSKSLVPMQRQEIIDLALRELAQFFPVVNSATLEKAVVVKEVRATYSVRPLLDRIRPGAESPWPGIYLAGDFTATGWPSTMEGAVRSGYLAAESLTRDSGEARQFLIPDLPHSGLMRLFR